jgi:tetratricopeptide (TPR) repeat protein
MEWAARFKVEQHLFRGVSTESYKIEPSACRRLPKSHRNNPSKLLKINKDLIEKARSLGHDQKDGKQLSDLELLAELQHFGAATCLIDFSHNALIALWFACQQSSKGKANGKVFAVNRYDIIHLKTVTPDLVKKNIDHFLKPDRNNKYLLYQWQPKLQNNRIIAQQSVFLFSGSQIEAEAECVIEKSSKQDILTSLEQILGLTEASIYPDFDGFARLHAQDKPYIEPDPIGFWVRGIYAHQANNLDDAIEYYTEVIQLDPEDSSIVTAAYHQRGNARIEKRVIDSAIKDYNRVIEDYSKAIELNPSDFRAYENLAEAYCQRGDAHYRRDNDDLAIKDYTKAIEMHPNYAEAFHGRAIAYQSKGDYQEAINDLTNTIHFNPDDVFVYCERGLVYDDKGDYESAIKDYSKVIKLNPDDPNAYYLRGDSYRYKEDYGKAIKDYSKMIELSPNSTIGYYNRGLAYLHLKNWEKAKSDLTTAKDMEENIITEFLKHHKSVLDFEQKHNVTLPADIVEMLTPPQT